MNDHERPCHYCGEPVDVRSRLTWHRMTGWERRGKAGGSDIALRERHGEALAHDHCVQLAKSGLAPGQGALL